jgi:Tfp pilus assembly protein PilF
VGDVLFKNRALTLWRHGYQHHMRAFACAGQDRDELACEELSAAIELYSKSIDVCPTAEAHTFRGWAYRSLGRLDEAIDECKRAIEVDPAFGNPYNDIGAYLIDKGEPDEACAWFEKAKTAPRYEPRHYPYMNLGRVYAAKGMMVKAITEVEQGLEAAPDDDARAALHKMLGQLRATLN